MVESCERKLRKVEEQCLQFYSISINKNFFLSFIANLPIILIINLMRRRHLFILTFISTLLCIYCAAQDIHFDLVKPPKEEPWGWLRSITQDSQGFLWIAAEDGLYKYDGYKCTGYHNEPSNINSLSSNWLECIYAEKDFLLIGTHRTGLDRFDLLTCQFTNYRYNAKDPASLSNDIVTSILKDRQGRYWIGTHEGLNQFNPLTGKFIRYKNNPTDSFSLSDTRYV